MLAFEVKDINRKANIVEIMIVAGPKMLEKLTIVVVKDVGWHCTWEYFRKGCL